MSETIVIFRKDRTGWKDCFALFPELPSDEFGNLCTAFQHVGQHCAADYQPLHCQQRPGYARRLPRPLRRIGTAGIQPGGSPASHPRNARTSPPNRR